MIQKREQMRTEIVMKEKELNKVKNVVEKKDAEI